MERRAKATGFVALALAAGAGVLALWALASEPERSAAAGPSARPPAARVADGAAALVEPVIPPAAPRVAAPSLEPVVADTRAAGLLRAGATEGESLPRIVGTVVDDRARPVAGSMVRLIGGVGQGARAVTDAAGAFAFDVAAGPYRLVVEPASLPPGLSTTEELQRPRPGSYAVVPEAFSSAGVMLAGGEVATIELRVFRTAHLTGVVVGPRAEPVAGAEIRLAPRVHAAGDLTRKARTDEHGRFELANVRVAPYRLDVRSVSARDARHRELSRPAPLDVDVTDAGSHALPTIRLGLDPAPARAAPVELPASGRPGGARAASVRSSD